MNYDEMEKMMEYWNNHFSDEIEIIYSTPSRYLSDIKAQNNYRKWPLRKDDMFPFADDKDSYWSGFFTTRPLLKHLEREVSGLMHSSQYMRSMFALSRLQNANLTDMVFVSQFNFMDTLGIL